MSQGPAATRGTVATRPRASREIMSNRYYYGILVKNSLLGVMSGAFIVGPWGLVFSFIPVPSV